MTNGEQKANAELGELFSKWKTEHRELNTQLIDISRWMNDASNRSLPTYEAAISRLMQLQQKLEQHFEHEEKLGYLLARSRGSSTVEIDAVSRQVDRDHRTLAARLEAIIGLLELGQPAGDSWPDIVVEFNLFIDALEQHEEQEESSVSWLRCIAPTTLPGSEGAP